MGFGDALEHLRERCVRAIVGIEYAFKPENHITLP